MQYFLGVAQDIDIEQAIAPGAATAAAGSGVSVGMDLGPISVIANIGAIPSGDSVTFQLEEYNGTSWNIIPGTSAVTENHTTMPSGGVVGIQGNNTYNQVRVNVTAVTGTFQFSAILISQQRIGSSNPGLYSNYPAQLP